MRAARGTRLLRLFGAGIACWVVGAIYIVCTQPPRVAKVALPEGSTGYEVTTSGERMVRMLPALTVDDSLLEVPNVPSCDDADLGFGVNATLRQVVDRYAEMRASWFAPDVQDKRLQKQLRAARANSYFFAALLHNNAKVLPWWNRELVKLVLTLGNARLDNVFVSVYESGSSDQTAVMLHALFALLRELGVAGRLHTGPGKRTTDRISFLAKLRNEVLRPLLDAGPGAYTHVVYLNDVYFCARGAVEMVGYMPAARAGVLSSTLAYGADMVCAADYQGSSLDLYDVWAAHDLQGRHLKNKKPQLLEPAAFAEYEQNRPVQVSTCWNGMVAFRADAVVERGVRFRRNVPLECSASECDLFCRDLWSLGLGRILLVPRFKVAYDFSDFKRIREKVTNPKVGWKFRWQVPPDEPFAFEATPPAQLECCPITTTPTSQLVDIRECHADSAWAQLYALFGTPLAPGARELEVASALLRELGGAEATLGDAKRLVDTTAAQLRADGVSSASKLARSGGAPSTCGSHAARAIPRAIVQLGPSARLAEMRRTAVLSALTWIAQHPCYEYTFVTHAEALALLRRQYPAAAAAWPLLRNAGERADVLKYAWMHAHGGVYAESDTEPRRSLEQLIAPEDTLVVGLDADFASEDAARAWQRPRARAAATHVFAVAPGHSALARALELAVERTLAPAELHARQLDPLGFGSPAELETALKTGVAPFSDAVLGAPGVRVLGVHAFASPADDAAAGGGADGGGAAEFLRAQRAEAVKETQVWVSHASERTWASPARTLVSTEAFDHLPMQIGISGLLGDHYFKAFRGWLPAEGARRAARPEGGAPGQGGAEGAGGAGATRSDDDDAWLAPTWTAEHLLSPRDWQRVAQYAARSTMGRPADAPGAFAWLHANGTLSVCAGHGPTDPGASTLYQLDPPRPIEPSGRAVPMLSLHASGVLALYSATPCDGPCEVDTPAAGVERLEVLWSTPAEPAQWERPPSAAIVAGPQACLVHTLLLRPSDAMLATYCAQLLDGSYQTVPGELASALGLGAEPSADALARATPRGGVLVPRWTGVRAAPRGAAASLHGGGRLTDALGAALRSPSGNVVAALTADGQLCSYERAAYEGGRCAETRASGCAPALACAPRFRSPRAPYHLSLGDPWGRPAKKDDSQWSPRLCIWRGTADAPLHRVWCALELCADGSRPPCACDGGYRCILPPRAYAPARLRLLQTTGLGKLARIALGELVQRVRASVGMRLSVSDSGELALEWASNGTALWSTRSAGAEGAGTEGALHAAVDDRPIGAGGAAPARALDGGAVAAGGGARRASTVRDDGFLGTGQQLTSPSGLFAAYLNRTQLCVLDLGASARCARFAAADDEAACTRWCSPHPARVLASAAKPHAAPLLNYDCEKARLGADGLPIPRPGCELDLRDLWRDMHRWRNASAPGAIAVLTAVQHDTAAAAAGFNVGLRLPGGETRLRTADLCIRFGCDTPFACAKQPTLHWCALASHPAARPVVKRGDAFWSRPPKPTKRGEERKLLPYDVRGDPEYDALDFPARTDGFALELTDEGCLELRQARARGDEPARGFLWWSSCARPERVAKVESAGGGAAADDAPATTRAFVRVREVPIPDD